MWLVGQIVSYRMHVMLTRSTLKYIINVPMAELFRAHQVRNCDPMQGSEFAGVL